MQPQPEAAHPAGGIARTQPVFGTQPACTEALSAILPGIVHLLGNLLFTIQGNAHLAADSPSGQAIARAAHRGGEVVRLLGALLGDAVPQNLPADELLHLVTELARVALRERNCQLHNEPSDDPPGPRVDLQRTAQGALLTLQQFVAGLPDAIAGTVTIGRVAASGTATASAGQTLRLRIAFVPAEGMLPFPTAGAELVGNVMAAGRRAGLRLLPMVRGNALEVDLPTAMAGGAHPLEA